MRLCWRASRLKTVVLMSLSNKTMRRVRTKRLAAFVSGEIPFLTILFLERDVLRLSIERTGGMGAQYPEPWPGVICPPLQWEVKVKEER